MNIFIDGHFERFYVKYPIVLADIGAAGGIDERWQAAGKHLRALCFEPDERNFRELAGKKSRDVRYLKTGLLDRKGQADLNLTKKSRCSSVLRPNVELLKDFPDPARYKVTGSEKIEVDTLDSQLSKLDSPDVDFIKLDTQGTELLILKGARVTLEGAVFGVEMEVEFIPLYENQPLFAEVDVFMRELGFQLFDLRRYFWKRNLGQDTRGKGQIIYADALYLKSLDSIEKSWIGIDEMRKARALKAVSISLIYGYFDYALAICERAHMKGIFNGKEKDIVFNCIMTQAGAHKGLLSLDGDGPIGHSAHRIHELLSSKKWSRGDDILGN
jgi:FkbM family methyltransferase